LNSLRSGLNPATGVRGRRTVADVDRLEQVQPPARLQCAADVLECAHRIA
jgi:hypothetical protein